MAKPADNVEPDEPSSSPPAVPDHEVAPAWARELKETIESLPGRLRATLTDDDRNSIAESVHGLFERSGAFHAPEPEPEPGDDEAPGDGEPVGDGDNPPARTTLAERLGFPKY